MVSFPSPNRLRCLSFVTKNIQSLVSSEARDSILDLLKEGPSCVFLQETRWGPSRSFLEFLNRATLLGYHLVGDPKGLSAILVQNDLLSIDSPENTLRDLLDPPFRRYVADVTLVVNQLPIRAVSIYTPCSPAERGIMFGQLSHALSNEHRLLLGGDYNCIINPLTDQDPPRRQSSQDCSVLDLQVMLRALHLVDTFRPPAECSSHTSGSFTNDPRNSRAKRRLDRFYISQTLLTWCRKTIIDHQDIRFSTHRKVTLLVQDQATELGRGIFSIGCDTLNNEVLRQLLWKRAPKRDDPLLDWDHVITHIGLMAKAVAARLRILSDKRGYGILSPEKIALTQEKANLMVKGITYSNVRRRIQLRRKQVDFPTGWNGGLEATLRNATGLFRQRFKKSTTDEVQRSQFFHQYGQSLHLDSLQRATLNKEYSLEELEKTIAHYAKKGSSPGADGIPYKYFLDEFDELGPKLLAVINKLHEGDGVPRNFQQTYLKLIPKKGDRANLENYRPITISNVGLRLAAAVVNRRLVQLLPALVHNDQTGFIPTRDPKSNVQTFRILREQLVSRFMGQSEPALAGSTIAQVDLEKAYDKVSWDYLFALLEHGGFGDRFIQFIKNITVHQQTSVCLNGAMGAEFPFEAGVPQGSPISPSLFVLCLEPLANALRANLAGLELETPMGSKVPLRVLLYADDIIVFMRSRADRHSFTQIWERFQTISGLRLNLKKSVLLVLGETAPYELEESLPCSFALADMAAFTGKYLGIRYYPHDWGDRKVVDYMTQASMHGLPVMVKATMVNMYVFSKLFYFDQHDPMPLEHILALEKEVQRVIHRGTPYTTLLPPKLLKGPRSLGRYGLLDLHPQLMGRRALWIYETFFEAHEVIPAYETYMRDVFDSFTGYVNTQLHTSYTSFHILTQQTYPTGIDLLNRFYDRFKDTQSALQDMTHFSARFFQYLQAWFTLTHRATDPGETSNLPEREAAKALLWDLQDKPLTRASFRRTGQKYYFTHLSPYVSDSVDLYLPDVHTRMDRFLADVKQFWGKVSRLYFSDPRKCDALMKFSHLAQLRLHGNSVKCPFCQVQAEHLMVHLVENCEVMLHLWTKIRPQSDVERLTLQHLLFPNVRMAHLRARGRFLAEIEVLQYASFRGARMVSISEWKTKIDGIHL